VVSFLSAALAAVLLFSACWLSTPAAAAQENPYFVVLPTILEEPGNLESRVFLHLWQPSGGVTTPPFWAELNTRKPALVSTDCTCWPDPVSRTCTVFYRLPLENRFRPPEAVNLHLNPVLYFEYEHKSGGTDPQEVEGPTLIDRPWVSNRHGSEERSTKWS